MFIEVARYLRRNKNKIFIKKPALRLARHSADDYQHNFSASLLISASNNGKPIEANSTPEAGNRRRREMVERTAREIVGFERREIVRGEVVFFASFIVIWPGDRMPLHSLDGAQRR